MSGEAKVLNGLLQRRALEEAFAELGRSTDPAAVQQRAQAIATYGSAALQHLLMLLDTPDPQLRGSLGQVARYLPHEEVVPALRGVARAQERSDQARLAAVTVLERFLGERIDDALIAGLRDPDAASRQSLSELIVAMDREPLSVVEYLEQLATQPPEIGAMVLDALPLMAPSPHLATFLRMLAQGENPGQARRAVEELAKMRTPAAARALASLLPNLPAALASHAERGLRKLHFSGVSESADYDSQCEPWYAPHLRWRLLMSPVDAAGGQFLWFIGRASADAPEDGLRTVFFIVLVQDPDGVRDASGSLEADAAHMPPTRRVGALHFVVGSGETPGLTLLESPLGVGLTALREAVEQNWERGEATPMGYRLFSPLIWLSDEASGDEATAVTPPADPHLPQTELDGLLDHPAFYGWFGEIDGDAFGREIATTYRRRFAAMSRWLATAGEAKNARVAATIAHHLEVMSPVASLFLAAARTRRKHLSDQSKENHNV